MNLSRLNDFSRRFARTLLAAFPDWQAYAVVGEADDDGGVLLVEVPSPPSAAEKHPLRISTEDDEITVGFDYYHTHLNPYTKDEEAERFREALSFIHDLVSENICVASWWSGEDWRGSTTVDTRSLPVAPSWAQSAERLRVRSWCGTHDRDEPV